MEATEIDVVGGRSYLDMLVAEQVLSSDHIAQELLDAPGEAVESGVRVQLEQTQKIMEMLSADLSFAFMAGDRLIGFMNLRDDRTEEAFSSYEISLFASITAQVTTAVENSELVRKLKDRDRLSALGEMATGMAQKPKPSRCCEISSATFVAGRPGCRVSEPIERHHR